MIVMKLKDDGSNSVPLRRIRLESSGLEVRPDKETGRVWVSTEAEATELEREGWQRVATSKAVDAETMRKGFRVASRRAGFTPIADKKVGDDDLLRLAKEAEYRHTTGHEPPEREQVDFGEIDAGSFGRLRVRHHILHGEVSIANVNSDIADLDTDLKDAFLRASGEYVESLGDVEMQAPAKATIGALVAAVLSRHGHIADAVRRQKFRARYSV